MGSIGIQFLTFVGLAFYGIVFFFVWKFYQILSRINDNIAGIRHAVERNGGDRPTGL
jgi:hypothetical protein